MRPHSTLQMLWYPSAAEDRIGSRCKSLDLPWKCLLFLYLALRAPDQGLHKCAKTHLLDSGYSDFKRYMSQSKAEASLEHRIAKSLPWCSVQNSKWREREREVYSFSQISTSVSRATITIGTHDNEGYLDRNSNPDTTSLLPIIHSFDLSSARSRENPEPHKTTWEKASPQALRPSPPHCLRDRVKNSIIRKPSGKNVWSEKRLVPCENLQAARVDIGASQHGAS